MKTQAASRAYRVQLACPLNGDAVNMVVHHAESGRDALRLALKRPTTHNPALARHCRPLYIIKSTTKQEDCRHACS